MINPYRYIYHSIHLLHVDVTSTLLFIIDNNIENYTRDVLQGQLIRVLKRKGTKFEKYLKDIVAELANLDAGQKVYFRNAIERNNRIEDLCNNTIQPILYSDIAANLSEKLSNLLYDFCYFLWEESYEYDGVVKFYGTILEHHKEFKEGQRIKVCPLCGITGLKPPGRKVREAYDHYLPKTYYPFNSINLYNLVPTCHYCNSDEKNN